MKDKSRHFAVILGARPNFVKAAPFFLEAKKHPEFKFTLIHTGQHFDDNMSRIFFEEMQIPRPDIHLHIQGDFHTEKIGKMFSGLKAVVKQNGFEGVIVFGDINSTLAGALAAVKNNCRLIHIEAGLRSHDRRMPEEINRAIVDHLSDKLFTTEPAANTNLQKEGIESDKVHYVGNIMIESIETFWDKIMACDILDKLKLQPKNYILVTIHRVENTDDPQALAKILNIINKINQKIPVIFPLHPGTKKQISNYKLDYLIDNLNIIEPLGYFEFMKLMIESQGVVTDSGGIQEETSHLGIACCTLRDNTERPITLEQGSNKLFSIDIDDIDEMIKHLQRTDFKSRHIPLWDKEVSQRIFKLL